MAGNIWITPLGGVLVLQAVTIALIWVVIMNWRRGHKSEALLAIAAACLIELVASVAAYLRL
jgi:hypothetical protein